MAQMENIGAFIKSNYDLAGAPLLALVLLGLEKLMDTEFTCPSDRGFGIVYSLVFVFGTTLILIILVNSCQCFDVCGTQHKAEDMEKGASVITSHHEYKDRKCGCCCIILQPVFRFVMKYKAPIFWLLILVTDGRYVECFIRSILENNRTTTTEVKGFILQIIQVVGLGLILIFIIILRCTCETKSTQYENKHKDIIFQYTQNALEEHKKQKLEAFVSQSMKVDDWDPECLNAEKKWEQITEDCRNNVVQNLKEAVVELELPYIVK